MSDIIERLRARAEYDDVPLFAQAADEIERLREENKLLLEVAGAGVETTYQLLKQHDPSWGTGRKMPKREP